MTDHHSAYLAQAVAALPPEGRARDDDLLEQLTQAAGGRAEVARVAAAREAEADTGELADDETPVLSSHEIDALTAGFMTIRDQEPLDDVAQWANAVLALLADIGGPHS